MSTQHFLRGILIQILVPILLLSSCSGTVGNTDNTANIESIKENNRLDDLSEYTFTDSKDNTIIIYTDHDNQEIQIEETSLEETSLPKELKDGILTYSPVDGLYYEVIPKTQHLAIRFVTKNNIASKHVRLCIFNKDIALFDCDIGTQETIKDIIILKFFDLQTDKTYGLFFPTTHKPSVSSEVVQNQL